MTVLETILVFVVPSVGLCLLIAGLVVLPRRARRPRYRSGQRWSFEPVWWTANPEGAQLPAVFGSTASDSTASDHPTSEHAVAGSRGGARGSW